MRPTLLAQSYRYVILLAILLVVAPATSSASTIFTEDFESGWGWWYADNGVWDVGTPTHGPTAAFEGAACAGTTLDGPYPQNANSRLISPPITLPVSPDGGGIWLDLENWFALGAGDVVMIEITDNGTVTWNSLGVVFANASECWTHHRTTIDVSEYAGDTVQIALHVVDDGGAAANPAGFFLDLFTVWDGAAPALSLPADFESGNAGWFADNGSWQIGQPTVGPMGGYESDSCAGTNIDGPYARYADSRLVGPLVDLGTPGGGNSLYLTFRHWGSVSRTDTVLVEVTSDGLSWTPVTGILANTNEEWQPVHVDISAFAGQSVSFGFRIRDDGGSGINDDGWFIDGVDLAEGPPRTWPPEEGFENGFAGWYVEGGTWEIGTPTAGPALTHGGSNCAGTNLGGNYPRYANARLISPPTTLPSSPADGTLQISFWQWYYLYNHGDHLYVEIRGDDGMWVELSSATTIRANSWTRDLVDISDYAGQTVQVAFRFYDNGDGAESHGWFLDDIDIVEGLPGTWTGETFEAGIGGWHADSGTWEIGTPGQGFPAFQGTSCAGTRLDANYERYTDSRLISPPTTLSANPADGSLQFSFWHRFYLHSHGDDLQVQIRPDGGDWTELYDCGPIRATSWTRMLVDVSAYAGQTVQFAFQILDNGDGGESQGWFIDNLEIVEGLPESWTSETFEDGLGGWYVESGTWNVGAPSAGPAAAFGGMNCAGTRLDSNYERYADTRLISPPTVLASSPEDGTLQLSYWQWYYLHSHGDHSYVQIRPQGGEWTELYSRVPIRGSSWTRMLVDVSAYAGQTVQFAFHFLDNGDGGESHGWFIDDLEIVEGQPDAWTTEDFENGIGGWYVESGTWGVGAPEAGPAAAFGGMNCAGTRLDTNYERYADSRLVSPPTTLASNPADGTIQLSFWQWFYIYNHGDHSYVQIRTEGGEWTELYSRGPIRGPSWTRMLVDVSAYAGQTVQFAFHFVDNWDGGESYGWFIDDLEIIEGLPAPWTTEDFEDGIGGWYVESGTWGVGTPEAGPPAAYAGDGCAGTRLDADYERWADSRLVSPPTVLTANPTDGLLTLRFQQWYRRYNHGDLFTLEVSAAGGEWTVVYQAGGLVAQDWIPLNVDIAAYAGQSVRFAFHIYDNGDGGESHGWFVDDIEIVEGWQADPFPQSFETGWGGWYADGGSWQVGSPDAGPSRAHKGDLCAGTNLDGNYPRYCDTRLTSPAITLDFPSSDGTYWLSYWHWFVRYNLGDHLYVEVKGESGTWDTLLDIASQSSTNWTRGLLDLSAYAGQEVQVGFRIYDNWDGGESHGWFVDDVDILGGTPVFTSPDNFENADWAQLPDLGGWSADHGAWEFGKPEYGGGPAAAFEGEFCAGTVMDGNYRYQTHSRLVSPPLTLDPTPMAGQLWLTFNHWYNFYANDTGTLEILLPDSSWTPITDPLTRSGGDWTMRVVDVSQWAGQTVQFGFKLNDDPGHTSYVAPGWYIDKVSLVEGPMLYNNPEYFETRTKGWSADAGSWQIGEPTVGPASAHEGQWCAGTVLDGNYPRYADTRIISPEMTLPAGPLARFYQWFELAANDSALFEISVGGGGWVQLAGFTTTADWTPYVSNLAAYAGQDVRFAFHLKDANNDGVQAAGWYVDSFEILNMPVGGPDAPVFHDVTYSADTPVLSWDIVDADHTRMAVYAGHFDAYVPDFGNRIALTTDEPYLDVAHPGWRSGYYISSVTALWQESDLVAPGEVIGVEDETPQYATALGQNYPNPFNPTTVVTFTLARDADVAIDIFDVAGHKVATLLQERLEAGRYEIPFDGRRHASGVYFCRFQTEGYSEVRKMALVK